MFIRFDSVTVECLVDVAEHGNAGEEQYGEWHIQRKPLGNIPCRDASEWLYFNLKSLCINALCRPPLKYRHTTI